MATFPHSRILVLFCVTACVGCASVRPPEGVSYDVDINGANWTVKRAIKESTSTYKLRKNPPSTIGQLRYRMEKDRSTIKAILESNGYYDGTVNLLLDRSHQPIEVDIDIGQGKQYHYRQVDVEFLGKPDQSLQRIKSRIRRKQHVVAKAVFEEQKRILELIKRRGYPFPRLVRRTVNVDHEQKVVDLALVFDPGRPACFGPVEVKGLKTISDHLIRRQLPWDAGDPYDAKKVEDFKKKLLESDLFGSVRIDLAKPAADTGSIPVQIQVTERSQHTIRLGVNYSDIGPGAKGYWENRNLFGEGERLETSLAWNPITLSGSTVFTRSGFLDANQSLVLNLDATRDSPDAYDAKKVTGSAMILHDFTSTIQVGAGAGYKYSRVRQLTSDTHYSHIFLPLQLQYDSRNDRLNPVRGMQMFGRTVYFDDTLGSQSFLKSRLEARNYAMLWEWYRLSSALRMTLGSIDGASIGAVPADERFYAGGGGSIRGYEYQAVGPQLNGVPTGGDKLVEFSAELRLQPGRRLGYAAFVDGGTVYDEMTDNFDRSLRYGAGAGLRWFTAIGPLRIDLAYPLNPSNDQVSRVQFYISLGQAF